MRNYASAHPDQALLVIEVADTSLVYDRGTKVPLYAASNVAEVWVVDIAAQSIESFTNPVNGTYQHVRRVTLGQELAPVAFPDFVLRVDELLR